MVVLLFFDQESRRVATDHFFLAQVAVKELKRFAKKLFPGLEVTDAVGGACVTAKVRGGICPTGLLHLQAQQIYEKKIMTMMRFPMACSITCLKLNLLCL